MQRSVVRQLIVRYGSSSSAAGTEKLVLGCGSNVVDHIYRVRVVPQAGAKGFFSSPFRALEKRLIGGVTLNHLSWSALGGVRAGLLALQGNDELGGLIRRNLRGLGVATDFITIDASYSTAQCHVFVQDGGERSIMMAPSATSLISAEAVRDNFDEAIQQHSSMVTTEISQVPLSGVLELLKSAKRAGVLSVLDLDIPPSVAEKEAELGTVEEVVECVKMADILKPAKEAAEELVSLMAGPLRGSESCCDVAQELVRLCGSKLVAMTNGGSNSVLANDSHVVEVAPPPVSEVLDTTGAGDAFLGGLIVGMSREGGLPGDREGMRELGRIANAFGATCTQSFGGVPTNSSREILLRYLPGFELAEAVNDVGGEMAGFCSSLAGDRAAVSAVCEGLSDGKPQSFVTALSTCTGTIFTSGIGKSGAVASRFAGSLSSLGLPSNFVSAAEWIHGDLGKVCAGRDVVVFLSHGGGTRECIEAASYLVRRGVAVLAITSNPDSELSQLALASLTYPAEGFEEPFQIMPTSTLVVQEMLCNALLCELIQKKGVTKERFLSNHPGGSIGRKR